MTYGIVSNLDNEVTVTAFRGKKIAKNRIVGIQDLKKLAAILTEGDTIYVVSVNRFMSVTQVLAFGSFCFEKGVSLRFFSQPYLDLSDGKHWKNSVLAQMQKMVSVEEGAKHRLMQCFRMEREQWACLFRCLEIMNLEVLAHMFSQDGVLRRGT